MSTDLLAGKRHAGRNTIYVVAEEDGLALAKRFDGPDVDRDRRFSNTVDWEKVQAIRGDDFSPRLLRTDPVERRVWFPYLDSAETLQSQIEGRTSWSAVSDALRDCGRRLGDVHSLTGQSLILDLFTARPALSEPPDPLAMFHAISGQQYAEASGGELECWALFHHDHELRSALQAWMEDQGQDPAIAPIHGDLRPDQFLIDGSRVHIIDWEEWTLGPTTRDLAGMVGALVFDALHGAFVRAAAATGGVGEVHANVLARAGEALAEVSVATGAFLEGYAAASPHPVDPVRLGARSVGPCSSGSSPAQCSPTGSPPSTRRSRASGGRP